MSEQQSGRRSSPRGAALYDPTAGHHIRERPTNRALVTPPGRFATRPVAPPRAETARPGARRTEGSRAVAAARPHAANAADSASVSAARTWCAPLRLGGRIAAGAGEGWGAARWGKKSRLGGWPNMTGVPPGVVYGDSNPRPSDPKSDALIHCATRPGRRTCRHAILLCGWGPAYINLQTSGNSLHYEPFP
eukprot:scaffold683_cov423-Prasinococcus_capsulatus_cf.AAC.8